MSYLMGHSAWCLGMISFGNRHRHIFKYWNANRNRIRAIWTPPSDNIKHERLDINRASSRYTRWVHDSGVVEKRRRTKMNHYDIVFIGQLGMGTIVPFRGSPFTEPGGPALFASIGASCLGKRVATVTRISESDEYH